jgi:VWFA-related protein
MSRSFIVALAVALLLSPAPLTCAQQPAPEELPNISVDVDVVNVLFSVRDKTGRLISTLGQSDFTIEEEGQAQTIKYFSRQTDLPVTLGLLVDTSVSQGNLIDQERMASSQFFTQVLRPRKDQAFLISFDISVDLLQDFTDSPRLLRPALDKLHVNAEVVGPNPGPLPTTSKPKGTLLYDAVYLAANDMLRGQIGRKAVVLLTDGNDFGSQLNLKQAIEAAQKSDVIIYGVLYVDRGFYQRRGGYGMLGGFGGGSELKKMCEETGGRMFEVSRKMGLREIYDEIQQELRSQYSIGYTPGADRAGYRRIKVLAKDRNLKVQARNGYYPKAAAAAR